MDLTNGDNRPCSAHILISQFPFIDRQITHQEPDAELTEEPLVMLIILLVVKLDVVQGVVGRGQAHLTAPVELKLTLFGVYFRFLEEAGEER